MELQSREMRDTAHMSHLGQDRTVQLKILLLKKKTVGKIISFFLGRKEQLAAMGAGSPVSMEHTSAADSFQIRQ